MGRATTSILEFRALHQLGVDGAGGGETTRSQGKVTEPSRAEGQSLRPPDPCHVQVGRDESQESSDVKGECGRPETWDR